MISILPARRSGTGWSAGTFSVLWISSCANSEGTSPLPDAAGTTGAPAPDAETKPLRILIIEDNRDYADGLQIVFEILGHAAMVTYDGIAGVEAALREPPDVVVCDIGLPGMDGYEVARALRQSPAAAATFLVAVTGYASDSDRERAYQAGFDAHLAKPAEAADILALVNAARRDVS